MKCELHLLTFDIQTVAKEMESLKRNLESKDCLQFIQLLNVLLLLRK